MGVSEHIGGIPQIWPAVELQPKFLNHVSSEVQQQQVEGKHQEEPSQECAQGGGGFAK